MRADVIAQRMLPFRRDTMRDASRASREERRRLALALEGLAAELRRLAAAGPTRRPAR